LFNLKLIENSQEEPSNENLSKKFDIFELVKLGAIQFTLMFGAYSAARAKVKPSTAPFADETMAWFGKPCCTATVENKTIDP